LKILWFGNAPWNPSGYGEQAALFLPRIEALGHEVACVANFGLQGTMSQWRGITILPANGTSDTDGMLAWFDKMEPDLVISLCDSWTLKPRQWDHVPLAAWAPVDHYPLPPAVHGTLKEPNVKPIAMSRFGEAQMRKRKLDPLYIPHGCFDYHARVATAKGEVALGDIVTESVHVAEVLSYDMATGKLRCAEVLKRHRLPLRDSHALRVRTESGRSMVITRDNEILTGRGWLKAGNLSLSDVVATVNVHGGKASASLDTSGGRLVARELRDSDQDGHSRSLSRQTVGSDTAEGEQGTRYLPKWPSRVHATASSEAQIDDGRVGIHRGDHRWGRSHQFDPSEAEKWLHPLHAKTRSDESVRSADWVDRRTYCMDDSRSHSRQGRMGLGISTSRDGASRARHSDTAIAVLDRQAPPGGVGDRVLRHTSGSQCQLESSRGGRAHLSADEAIEREDIATYERVVSISPVWLEEVYDLTTSTGTFVVDGIVVHNCDTEVFKPRPEAKTLMRESMGVPEDAFLIGMVGANRSPAQFPRKSQPQAFLAFAEFLKTHPDAWLYAYTQPVGDLNLDALLLTIADSFGEEILKRVKFPPDNLWYWGFGREQMAEMYSAFDVLLNPSMGEGFGVPIIEAQACGVPVIVSNHSSMPELLGAGWLVEGDPWWDEAQHSFGLVPHVDSIVEALERAYKARGDSAPREEAVAFAQAYDADRVLEAYWVPALEALGKPREVAPLKPRQERGGRKMAIPGSKR
jgi:glycosyltransferase involved in cell wall biosynthesis